MFNLTYFPPSLAGLGVLSVSALAGILANKAPAGAPFLGIAGIDLLLAVGAIAVGIRSVQQ